MGKTNLDAAILSHWPWAVRVGARHLVVEVSMAIFDNRTKSWLHAARVGHRMLWTSAYNPNPKPNPNPIPKP